MFLLFSLSKLLKYSQIQHQSQHLLNFHLHVSSKILYDQFISNTENKLNSFANLFSSSWQGELHHIYFVQLKELTFSLFLTEFYINYFKCIDYRSLLALCKSTIIYQSISLKYR